MRRLGARVLHKRVVASAEAEGIVPERARRWVAAAAFFELLNTAAAERTIEQYFIKGGFSVELRYKNQARTSDDIDIAIVGAVDAVSLLRVVIRSSWSTFSFTIKGIEEREHATRVLVQVTFNSTAWCTLKLDVLEESLAETEEVDAPDIARFGLPETKGVVCLSRPQQLAQYIHAITKPPQEGELRDRSRNLIDVYLFDTFDPCDDAQVARSAQEVFDREASHTWPPTFIMPSDWSDGLDAKAQEIGLALDARGLANYFTAYLARVTKQPSLTMALAHGRLIKAKEILK